MRTGGKTTLAIVAVVVVAALSGCGPFGGGDEQLTKDELIAEGDEICKRGREQYLDLQQSPPKSSSEAAALTRQLIEITEGEISDLQELNAPPESQDALDDYLASREAGLKVLHEGLEAAEHDDAQAYAEAQAKIAEGQVQRTRLADLVGFTECSRPLTESTEPG
ncbi:MAG TPA: hypothetical protein VEK39_03645 [Solirubrobacterales bacterium]|nr:hypothetical protein [Solirubrobacterales bacterium]